ncbi:ornithine cyclodeaminase family protein [Paucibacter sp. PLA-PC-4]|uniref:ornithine cyclodeaminase family protein n=1 Tax=Paucibacter sp. PLA-PC-4 TaxID=2993655 RepID=UPI00224B2FF5|nr:ornithine cyclodeaminase family protein [Paucibacter sp. PLA-PC-4]MCX2864394.1 ornithine cyclodeaminase family protein [Paucibacter sp. PLA-PC-4]
MLLITEAQVAQALSLAPAAAIHSALRQAFVHLAEGRAAVLARGRAGATAADGAALMVSAMGAVLDDVMGTKVYSTRNGQFQFVITLFDSASGAPLATLEANELTRLRTAATTALAVDALAAPEASVLALFGAGTQARAHVQALRGLRRFERVLVCARSGGEAFAAEIGAELVDAASAAAQGDVIVTCTRASEPLFDGTLVRPGALVAAVGSSKPAARELDDTLLARAAAVVVEWLPAARAEAGELVRAAPGVIVPERLIELGSLLAAPLPQDPQAITVYKSVGIGLEDVALARLVYQTLTNG